MTQSAAVIGLGLIGGSLGGALRRSGYRVRGHDISPRHAAVALESGLVDDVAASGAAAAADANVVLIAVPVLRSLKLLLQLDHVTPPDALILDTGSVKRVVLDAMAATPGSSRMIGGHPLAGSSRSGPSSADADMFRGRTFFLVATPGSSTSARDAATALVRCVGAEPIWVDADEHDRMLASTSHVPQVLSSLLAASVPSPGLFAGPGFHQMTRLAGSDPAVWRDILLANADRVLDAGRSYRDSLSALLDAIEAEDVASIERVLIAGQRAREDLEATA